MQLAVGGVVENWTAKFATFNFGAGVDGRGRADIQRVPVLSGRGEAVEIIAKGC